MASLTGTGVWKRSQVGNVTSKRYVEYNDLLVRARNPYGELRQRICAAYTGADAPRACA
jgi:hypothetical protein